MGVIYEIFVKLNSLETCSLFEGTLDMYDKSSNLLAEIVFNVSTSFNFYGNDVDYRNVAVESYKIVGDSNANANLEINLIDECLL